MSRWIGLLAAALIVAALIAASGGVWTKSVPAGVATASRGAIREFVEEEGKTRLPRTYLVTMPYDARVEPINLVEGQAVAAGQVVARVSQRDVELDLAAAEHEVERLEARILENDDDAVEQTGLQQTVRFVESMAATVEAAKARVTAGLARLEFAGRTAERTRRLQESSAVSQQDVDQAETRRIEADVDYQQDRLIYSAMQALQAATELTPTAVRQYIDRKTLTRDVLLKEKEAAEVSLQQARLRRERSEMTSPVDGVVLTRSDGNERLAAGGSTLLEIGRLQDLQIESDLLSDDAARVTPGQPVEVYGPTIGPLPISGVVERIFPEGFTKVSSLGVEQQRVKVIVNLDEAALERLVDSGRIGAEYRVNVRIVTREKTNARLLPRTAVFRDVDGAWYVYAIEDGVARQRRVEVGLMNDDAVEIVEGISDGAPVVAAPGPEVSDGVRIATVASRATSD